MAERIPPKAGPVMPPNKNPPLNNDWARPLKSSPTERINKDPAETENIEEPRPPKDLNINNCS